MFIAPQRVINLTCRPVIA